jgi:cell fate (sporulation/competence/biofilm development) regulator YlbF (YheA/YmcA/DUF963 family)
MKGKKRKLLGEYETRLGELESWRSEDVRMRSVIARLESAYADHKADLFVVARYRAMKEMIQTAAAEAKAIDEESVRRRARQRLPQYVEPAAATESPSESFRDNAEKLAKRTELEAMTRDQMKEALRKTHDEVHRVQRDYRANLRRLQTLSDEYKASKHLFWFWQRYHALKGMIKEAYRHQQTAHNTTSLTEEDQKELGSSWSVLRDSGDDSS